MSHSKDFENKFFFIIPIFFLLSLFFSVFYGEDTLGSAKHDYFHHEKYFALFSESFYKTFSEYGNNFEVRNSPIFYILRNKTKPYFALRFEIPKIKKIDKQLIFGSTLFGIGWGTVGFCPGPAISSLALLNPLSILFVISMVVGFYSSKIFIKNKKSIFYG